MNDKLRNMTSVYLLMDESILLLYRQGSRVVNDKWIGSAGGHFEENELNDPRACVLRELEEELCITEDDIEGLELRYITLRQTKGEIRQNYYFFGRLKDSFDREIASNEGVSRWFGLDEIQALEMPETAKYVTNHYCSVGRFDDKLYIGIFGAEGVCFCELPET